MGIAAPWFLAGLAAIAVPVYVHLLRQHKTTTLPFSSLMFFEHRTQSSVKHRRLKYLALFALRVATLALVALTFANLYTECASPGSPARALTVVALDRSLSMKVGDRMNRARAGATAVLGNARGPAEVLAFDTQTSILTQFTADKAALRSAVASVTAGDGRSSYAAVSRAITAIAKSNPGRIEAHLFTDVQRTSLPTPFTELALPLNVKLQVHALAAAPEPNWYVESVVAPRQIYRAGSTRVQATVAGSGSERSERAVSLLLGGKVVETRRVAIPANGRAQLEFFLSDVPHGFNRGTIRVDAPDALEQDNQYPFAIEHKDAGRVLFAGDSRSAMYYRTALESVPGAGLTVDQVNAGELANLGLEKYSMIVLTSPPPASDSLARYLASGGGLMIALGPAFVAQGRVPVTGERLLDSRYSPRDADRFQSVSSVDQTHPALAAVGPFEGVKFYQTIRLEPGEARVLARLNGGAPLLIERRLGEGKILIFASTLDNVANDLPLHASFIPFIAASARYLSGFDEASPDYAVGSSIALRSARESGTGVEVLGPSGTRELGLKEASTAQSFQFPREGVFEIRRANGRNEVIAVHSDRRESDLSLIPTETLALWQNTGGESPNNAAPGATPESRQNLWWYFALALLVVSLVESVLSAQYLAPQPERPIARKAAA